jgi:glycosyltransferase involved in cell wall biosynthesis
LPDGLISVIVPVHDGHRHLPAALESVLAQPGQPDLDVIVVDDGSHDLSWQVAEDYEDRGVRLVRVPTTRGDGVAHNTGVAVAHGDWIAFLDAEDEWTRDRLAAGLAAFEADPDLDVVFGYMEIFGENAAVESCRVPGWVPGTMLMRRRAWDRIGGFSAVRAGEVLDWLVEARELGLRKRMLPDVLLRRRSRREREPAMVLREALDRRRRGRPSAGTA